jgi:hypothetical protein
MTDSPVSVGPSNPDDIVRRGQEAWSRLQAGRSWEDWLAVGEAIQVGRRRAMIEANTNQPRGSRYDSMFGDWLQETSFDSLDKSDRKRLLDCLEHRAEIEAWRQTLPANKRLQLNHPTSVWRNWQRATVTGRAAVEKPARLSPVGKLKQEVVRLEDENLQLRRAGDDLFSSKDTVVDIARLLADRLLQRLSPEKARQVIERLPEMFAERVGLRRDAMRPAPPTQRNRRHTSEDFQCDLGGRKRPRPRQRWCRDRPHQLYLAC